MPLLKPLEAQRFSDAGPLPQALSVGENLAVMLLCLQAGQELVAPEGDAAETLFHVIDGSGWVLDGDQRHPVQACDTVHVMPGHGKALVAGEGALTVMGVRHMGQRRKA